MEITVINNRPAGGTQVYAVDDTTFNPGQTHVMTGRSLTDVAWQMASADGHNVMVLCKIEGADRAPIICDMKNPADPAGGVVLVNGAGFDLKTQAGAAAGVAPQMYMGVFDDAACTIPSVKGSLSTATAGTIDSGTGTHLVKVTPSGTGEVSLRLTVTGVGTYYMKAWPVGTSYVVDASETDSVTFTP
jgi:hypothetical protein